MADETSYPRLANEENCSRDEGSVEQNSSCLSSSRDLPEGILTCCNIVEPVGAPLRFGVP